MSKLEIDALRRIGNVARMDHVNDISNTRIHLVGGSIPTTPNNLHIGFSASAIGSSSLLKAIDKNDEEKWAVVDRIRENSPLAAMKLVTFQQQLKDAST